MMQTPRFQRGAPEPGTVAADRLDGSGAIAAFWFGRDTPENRKKVYRLSETKALPIRRFGGKLIASRRVLTEVHDRLTGMPADAAE
jgi:hypothetical protein